MDLNFCNVLETLRARNLPFLRLLGRWVVAGRAKQGRPECHLSTGLSARIGLLVPCCSVKQRPVHRRRSVKG